MGMINLEWLQNNQLGQKQKVKKWVSVQEFNTYPLHLGAANVVGSTEHFGSEVSNQLKAGILTFSLDVKHIVEAFQDNRIRMVLELYNNEQTLILTREKIVNEVYYHNLQSEPSTIYLSSIKKGNLTIKQECLFTGYDFKLDLYDFHDNDLSDLYANISVSFIGYKGI